VDEPRRRLVGGSGCVAGRGHALFAPLLMLLQEKLL